MKYITYIIWLSLLILGFKDNNINFADNQEFFPTSVGTRWIYHIYDSLSETSDKVEVEIIESKDFSDGKVSFWKYSFASGSQYVIYVVSSPEKVEFFKDESLSELIKTLILPLRLGKKWNST